MVEKLITGYRSQGLKTVRDAKGVLEESGLRRPTGESRCHLQLEGLRAMEGPCLLAGWPLLSSQLFGNCAFSMTTHLLPGPVDFPAL